MTSVWFGPWFDYHNEDRSHPADTPSSTTANVNDKGTNPTKPGEKGGNNERIIKFNNDTFGKCTNCCAFNATYTTNDRTSNIGQPIDNGAPYFLINIVELVVVALEELPRWNTKLEKILAALKECRYGKYGNGDHASQSRSVIVLIMFKGHSNDNAVAWICHLVLKDSSQLVIRQNITSYGDICQSGQLLLVLHQQNQPRILFFLYRLNHLL